MSEEKRTYGFLVETENRYGATYVTARIVCREGDSYHPINCRTESESAIFDCPPHLSGFHLDGLSLRGHVYEHGGEKDFIGFRPEFYDVYSIDERKAKAICRTLRRVHKQIEKEEAREPGDVLMAVARALKLSFFVEQGERTWESFGYGEYKWHWWPVEKARDEFRKQIEKAKGESIAA